ncbi:CorA metal ion transporter [Mucor velutinosus]|uniref:CorA metal ion transporter n=1 Tax=Mucor velutinosus TaxID=708070 RepID=A0AAN7DNR1_9FUNG|nr:CorA metal ion transporter [Mucor velutinosus]
MTDIILNAKSSTLRRVRLKPSLSNTSLLYSSSNCYLNSTPINNFVSPLSPPPCAFSSPSSLGTAKSADRVLKPSLRKLETIGSESIATAATIKSVHFNDPLTRVVHFYTPPPLDEYDKYDEEETEEDEEEEEQEEEESKLEDAFLELYMVNGLQDECDSLAIAQPPTTDSLGTNNRALGRDSLSLPNWPLTIHPARRFISQMVSLESLVWNHSLQVVQGRVLVHNLAFEKKVLVRCSLDDWKTWTDIDAYYKEPAFYGGLSDVSSNSALDRFMFDIHVPNKHAFSCDIAVRYQTLGQEFWDNNNGNNFTVQSMPLEPSLREKPLSFLKAIMQQEHGNNNNNNNKKGLSTIPTLNCMEYQNGIGSIYHQEKLKQSCRHGSRDDIVPQQPTAKTTAKTRYALDRFKFSKYGASKIPAVSIPVSKRSTMQHQQQTMGAQHVVVDLPEQQNGNIYDALACSSIMNNHDEAVDLKETLYA